MEIVRQFQLVEHSFNGSSKMLLISFLNLKLPPWTGKITELILCGNLERSTTADRFEINIEKEGFDHFTD